MRVLLFSMPDSFEHTPAVAIRMPNGALASLAGNAGAGHTVAVADLILAHDRVAPTVTRLIREHDPDVVGLSIMTFQRRTALRLVRLIRAIKPTVVVVAGGYDPSLAPEAYAPASSGIDYIVRGEGELTFRALLRALARGGDVTGIPGLSYRNVSASGDGFVDTPARPVTRLGDGEIVLPDRGARVLTGYTFLGRQIDIVETSRGCTYDCSFCSIIEMRGRNFHTFDFRRVLADIADARARGARAIFLVDDNITLNVARFAALCEAITAAGLNDIHSDEIEFLRWRAERWMKVRHLPSVLRHYPGFVLRNVPWMCAHTFRGSSWRSLLGLEDARSVFRRYKAIRAAEREYLPEPAGAAPSGAPLAAQT